MSAAKSVTALQIFEAEREIVDLSIEIEKLKERRAAAEKKREALVAARNQLIVNAVLYGKTYADVAETWGISSTTVMRIFRRR